MVSLGWPRPPLLVFLSEAGRTSCLFPGPWDRLPGLTARALVRSLQVSSQVQALGVHQPHLLNTYWVLNTRLAARQGGETTGREDRALSLKYSSAGEAVCPVTRSFFQEVLSPSQEDDVTDRYQQGTD